MSLNRHIHQTLKFLYLINIARQITVDKVQVTPTPAPPLATPLHNTNYIHMYINLICGIWWSVRLIMQTASEIINARTILYSFFRQQIRINEPKVQFSINSFSLCTNSALINWLQKEFRYTV